MKEAWNISLLLFAFFAIGGCVESYEPEVISKRNSFLVIEGFLNSGNDSSAIKLSRTVRLTDTASSVPESGAKVQIESESGAATFHLAESSDGNYILEPVELDFKDRYRLKIQTRGGKEYLSDYVEVKVTPPIDSISWVYEEDGVSIYANTHDPENNSWYYRWEFEEDWEYQPPYISYLEYDEKNNAMIQRQEPTADTCWSHNKSTNIIIGSSAKLGQDVISEQLVTFIPRATRRLLFRYSILVKQFVLSKEAFEYYQQMKKNSEEMGSFFDPQPMELEGNIRSISSPDEPVTGFFSIGSLQEKRMWINYYDVSRPLWGFRWSCPVPEPDTVKSSEWYKSFFIGTSVPLEFFPLSKNVVFYTNSFCVGCSGNDSEVRPPFWD